VDGSGYRFAQEYHPSGELAPRDVVSRAIFQHLQKTGDDHVWLDMRPIDEARLKYRFPNILNVCRHWGCDPLTQPVPVAPARPLLDGGHYHRSP
jgi:L-aspartate oxidase